MTLGAGNEGYPDQQRLANFDGVKLLELTRAAQKGTINSVIAAVSRYASINGVFSLLESEAEVTFSWFSTNTETNLLGRRVVCTSPNITNLGRFRLVNMGPWLRVAIASPANVTGSVIAFGSNRILAGELNTPEPVPLAVSEVWKAGESKTLYPGAYLSGPCQLLVTSAGESATVAVEALNAVGQWVAVYRESLAAGGHVNAEIALPSTALRVTVTNGKAGESAIAVALSPSPTASS